MLPMAAQKRSKRAMHVMQANGLLTSNSWAGYYVLLNPEYSGSTQWRFVNRAIDEVENDRVSMSLIPVV